MNLFEKHQAGLVYADFLRRHGSPSDRDRWARVREQVVLTDAQRRLLGSFRRTMPVLCLAGAWCGDCARQCPIFDVFAAATPVVQPRFLDRDEHADVQAVLRINGGNRVPVLVFFSEDGLEVARYGERTLSQYRQMVRETVPGQDVPPAESGEAMLGQVTRDWLNEFERVQWILRLSPRLRQRHGD